MANNDRIINRQTDEWVAKLRYSRSFMAKLIMSEPQVKEYYAALATKLLSYEKVRSHLTWSGIRFLSGRKTMALVTFAGKTLSVYFALDPASYAFGKYRLTDVSLIKRFAATPGRMRITSSRALAAALRLVESVAKENELEFRSTPIEPISAKDFPSDTFQNLLARGLIRLLKETVKPPRIVVDAPEVEECPVGNDVTDDETNTETNHESNAERNAEATVAPENSSNESEDATSDEALKNAYLDTLNVEKALVERHQVYRRLMDTVESYPSEMRMAKKRVLSVIDKTWIVAIEDCLQALDAVIRNPMHFIEESEELLPIERTKKVTQRSIQHLSQHSGLISRIEGDTIIPSKLLNIFRDDSLMTYENKFVNTLLMRLYDFVSMRYESAKEGADKEVTELDLDQRIETEDGTTGKVVVHVELSKPKRGKGKNLALQSDLWKRVVRLYETVCDYQHSQFAQAMGNACIRPPVMHTNAILKNKNLSQCLELWEFIEGYEDDKGLTEDERELDIDPDYMAHLYRTTTTQYLAFRTNADASEWMTSQDVAGRNNSPFAAITTIAGTVADGIVADTNARTDETRGEDEATESPNTYLVVQASEVESESPDDDYDDGYDETIIGDTGIEFDGHGTQRTQDESASPDEMLWAIRAALAADMAVDEVNKARLEAEQRRREEAEREAQDREAVTIEPKPPERTADMTPVELSEPYTPPDRDVDELPESEEPVESESGTEREEVLRIDEDGRATREVTTYRKSMQAKLQLASGIVKRYYTGIYNRLVAKDKVKARTSFEYVSFAVGGKTLARITIIGKTLRVYYALDPKELDGRYNVKDASDVKKYATTPTLIYVRSNRSYQYALELADMVTAGLADDQAPHTVSPEDYPYRPIEVLVDEGLVQRTVTEIPAGSNPFGGRVAPLRMPKTQRDADYSADYEEAARRLMAREKPKEERVLSLEGVADPADIRRVLEETDAQMERERQERQTTQNDQPELVPITGAGGDALFLRREVLTMSTDDADAPTLPSLAEQEKPVAREPVPMGGDALTPKPMTVDDIDQMNTDNATDDTDGASNGKKKVRFWQRFGRKRK